MPSFPDSTSDAESWDPNEVGPFDSCLTCFTPFGEKWAFCQTCGKVGTVFETPVEIGSKRCTKHRDIRAAGYCCLYCKPICDECTGNVVERFPMGLRFLECRSCLERSSQIREKFLALLAREGCCAKHQSRASKVNCVKCQLPLCAACAYFTVKGLIRRRAAQGPFCLVCFRMATLGAGHRAWISGDTFMERREVATKRDRASGELWSAIGTWDSTRHSEEENARWCHLRSIEWLHWPLFVTQPVVPLCLLVLPWYVVVLSVLLLTILWTLAQYRYVSVRLADFGPLFVYLKWPISVGVGIYFLIHESYFLGLLAGLYPMLVLIMSWPIALLGGDMARMERLFRERLAAQTMEGDGATKNVKDETRRPANAAGPFARSPSITVFSVAAEYRYIAQERCICGGVFKPARQAMGHSASGVFDVIDVTCVDCGSVRQFEFLLESIDPSLKLHPLLLERCVRAYRERSKEPHKAKEKLGRLIVAYLTGYLGDGTPRSKRDQRLTSDLTHAEASHEVGRILERAVNLVVDMESLDLKSGIVEGNDAGPNEDGMRTWGEQDRDVRESAN